MLSALSLSCSSGAGSGVPMQTGGSGGTGAWVGGGEGAGTSGTGGSSACAADLLSDPANCGACGHDCGGGACAEGACQPVNLYQGSVLPVLAKGPRGLWWVVVQNTGVNVAGTPTPGAPIEFVSGASAYFDYQVEGLWVRNQDLVVYSSKCCVGGGAHTLWVNTPGSATWTDWTDLSSGQFIADIEVDDSYAYAAWVGTSFFMIRKSVQGQHDVIGQYLVEDKGLALDGEQLFAVTADIAGTTEVRTLVRFSKSTFEATPLGSGDMKPNGYANVHLQAAKGLLVFANSQGIASLPYAGGTPTQIVTTSSTITSIALDENRVYWTEDPGGQPGIVMQANRDGSSPRAIASSPQPAAVIADSDAIYWVDHGGDSSAGVYMKVKDAL